MFTVILMMWFWADPEGSPQLLDERPMASIEACEMEHHARLEWIAQEAPKHKGPWQWEISCAVRMPPQSDVGG
jgi:hypothetical protein